MFVQKSLSIISTLMCLLETTTVCSEEILEEQDRIEMNMNNVVMGTEKPGFITPRQRNLC